MPKAMIITMGTGRNRKDIAGAISHSINQQNPNMILFLTTKQSHKETFPLIDKRILQEKEIKVDQFDEMNDVEKIYLHYMKVINALIEEGYHKKEIVIDYTSGTKAMSAGLFATGIALEVGSINYVAGTRDEGGRVIPGTERPMPISPKIIFAENRIETAKNLFNHYQFEAAIAIMRQAGESLRVPSITNRVEFLIKLNKAYKLWDTFELDEANSLFHELSQNEMMLTFFKIKDTVLKNRILVNQSKSHRYSTHRLVDLLHNAYRRMDESKYDDALARIYRTFEYMAQLKIYKDHNKIETKRVKLDSLPEDLKTKYRKNSNEKGEVENLSMVRAFELLYDLKDDLGKDFMNEYNKEDSPLCKLLNKRNNSILAHGFKHIDKEDCQLLLAGLTKYLDKYFPSWSDEKQNAIFPKF